MNDSTTNVERKARSFQFPLLATVAKLARRAEAIFRPPQGRSSGGIVPSFLITGAQRAGTTSLYYYLVEHPQIAPAARKEVHYFDVNFKEGVQWYWQQFAVPRGEAKEKMITGEASPYYLFHPLASRRAAELLPEVKLIVLLRNPIDRALSHYHHEVRRGRETLSFAEALSAEESRLQGEAERICREPMYRSTAHQCHSYRSRGCYMDQLEVWLRSFPREKMLVLLSERFYADPAATLRVVTDFLLLPPLPPESADNYKKHNLASYPGMDPDVRKELADFYRPHNQRLAEFLGESPGWDE